MVRAAELIINKKINKKKVPITTLEGQRHLRTPKYTMSALGLTRRGGLDAERQSEPRSAALHYSGNTTLREGDQELLKQVENKRDFIIFFLEICEFVCYKIEEKNGYNLRSPNLPPP